MRDMLLLGTYTCYNIVKRLHGKYTLICNYTLKGIELATRFKDAFTGLLLLLKGVSTQTLEISSATEELSASSEELSVSVNEIYGIAHDSADQIDSINSKTHSQLEIAQNIAKSSESLNHLAKDMEATIKQPKV